jgi:hypothetical protein
MVVHIQTISVKIVAPYIRLGILVKIRLGWH